MGLHATRPPRVKQLVPIGRWERQLLFVTSQKGSFEGLVCYQKGQLEGVWHPSAVHAQNRKGYL